MKYLYICVTKQNHLPKSQNYEPETKGLPNYRYHRNYRTFRGFNHQFLTMKKQKRGRKPIADKKKAVTIYVKDSDIKKLGGLANLKTHLLNHSFSLILNQ